MASIQEKSLIRKKEKKVSHLFQEVELRVKETYLTKRKKTLKIKQEF